MATEKRKQQRAAVKKIKEDIKKYKSTLDQLQVEWKSAQNNTQSVQVRILNKQIKECANMLQTRNTIDTKNDQFFNQHLSNSEEKVNKARQRAEEWKHKAEHARNCENRLKNLQNEYNNQLSINTNTTQQLNDLKSKIQEYDIELKKLEPEQTPRQQQRLAQCKEELTNKLQQMADNQANLKSKYLQLQQVNKELQGQVAAYKKQLQQQR